MAKDLLDYYKIYRYERNEMKLTILTYLMTGMLAFAGAQDFNPPYPRLGIFTFSGRSYASVDILKDFDVIAFPPTTSMATRYRDSNPDVILLGTSGSLIAYDMGEMPEEWYYHDWEGNRILLWAGTWLMNITELCPDVDLGDGYGPKKFIDHALLDVEQRIDTDLYDGVFHDWWWGGPGYTAKYYGDVNNNGVKDIEEIGVDSIRVLWQRGIMDFHDREYLIPDMKYVVVQIGTDWNVWPYIHGACFEDWTIYNGPWGRWRKIYTDDATPTKTPKIMLFDCAFSQVQSAFPVTPYKNNYQWVRFGLSSCLLMSAFFYVDEGNQIGHHGNIHIYDEFEAKGKLGYPVTDMIKLSNKPLASTPNANGVWVRFFDYGVSVVNATGLEQIVYASELQALDPSAPSDYYRFAGGQDPDFNNGEAVTDSNPLVLWGSTAMANWADPEVFGDGAMLFRTPDTLVTPIVVDNHVNNQTSPGTDPIQTAGTWYLSSDGEQYYACYNARNYGPFQPDGFAWSPSGTGANTALYVPTIGLSGWYEVQEWHGYRGNDPGDFPNASIVPATITYANGLDSAVTIVQNQNYGQWNAMGTFPFIKGTVGSVGISNQANGIVIADAIQFVFQRGLTEAEREMWEDPEPEPSALSFADSTVTRLGSTGQGPHGTAFADATGDGRADLYVTIYYKSDLSDLFFRNTGGAFIEEGAARTVNDYDGGSQGACFADLDNDGDYDLVNGTTIVRPSITPDHNNIYENNGSGYFIEQTPVAMEQTLKTTRGVLAFDMERDGDLDIFTISGYAGSSDSETGRPNEVYRNDGNFNFTELTDVQCGDLYDAPAGQGGTDTDYDGDGDIDIIAGNRSGDLNILRNDGTGYFTLVTPSSIGITHQGGEGITMGDVDNDGDLDMLLVSEGPPNEAYLYFNNGDSTFTYSGQAWQNINGFMGGFADLDNDMDLDLVFAGYLRCYLNDGTGVFEEGPTIPYAYPSIIDPRSVAFSDVDSDGDVDFVVGDKETKSRLIINNLANNNYWIKVNPIAPNGQAGAFGAKVTVYPEGQMGGTILGFRETRSANGFSAQDDPVMHFGLGAHISVDVAVLFLDGTLKEFRGVKAGRTLNIGSEYNQQFADGLAAIGAGE